MLALLIACGQSDPGDAPSSTPERPDDALAIRGVSVANADTVRDVIDQLGTGVVESGAIEYADLTGDLRDEAIVPVSSQGTLGNIAYVILTLVDGSPEAVLVRTVDRTAASGLQMTIEEGVLMETRAVYGPSDPFCCPSQLRQTTFQWDGAALQVKDEALVQQDPGPKR